MTGNKGILIVLALVAGALVVVVLTRKPTPPVVINPSGTPAAGGVKGPWDVLSSALPFIFPKNDGSADRPDYSDPAWGMG